MGDNRPCRIVFRDTAIDLPLIRVFGQSPLKMKALNHLTGLHKKTKYQILANLNL